MKDISLFLSPLSNKGTASSISRKNNLRETTIMYKRKHEIIIFTLQDFPHRHSLKEKKVSPFRHVVSIVRLISKLIVNFTGRILVRVFDFRAKNIILVRI